VKSCPELVLLLVLIQDFRHKKRTDGQKTIYFCPCPVCPNPFFEKFFQGIKKLRHEKYQLRPHVLMIFLIIVN